MTRHQRTEPKRRECLLTALFVAVLAWTSGWPGQARGDEVSIGPPSTELFALETFGAYELGSFPSKWKSRAGLAEAAAVYRVAEDGEHMRYLQARADGNSVMIGLDSAFEPTEYPYLQWRWRIHAFPEGGNELSKTTNDSAAGVYVVFPGRLPMFPRVLKYVWSTMAPVGSRERSPSYHDAAIVVLASGPASKPDEWRTETVNVRDDYQIIFGREAPAARGIGILTDGDATSTLAAADYADFRLLAGLPAPKPPVPTVPVTIPEAGGGQLQEARTQSAIADDAAPAPAPEAAGQSPPAGVGPSLDTPHSAPDSSAEGAVAPQAGAPKEITSPESALAGTNLATDTP